MDSIELLRYCGLFVTGLFAGVVDSSGGGGGVLTLPVLAITVGAGVPAVATNKVAGVLSALASFWVYFPGKASIQLRPLITLALASCLGALIGSRLASHISPELFRWMMIVCCPFLLWIVWKKELWASIPLENASMRSEGSDIFGLIALGLVLGTYDGIFGAASGTFYFLALLFLARMPLITALIFTKFVGLLTAGTSLAQFSYLGQVHWIQGLCIGTGTCLGAYFGSKLISRDAAKYLRPVLAVAVALLMIRLILS